MLHRVKDEFHELLMLITNDPYLPAIILGVIGAAFFFAFVLNADATVIFGVLLIGCVTAVLESKARHRKK